MSKLKKPVVKPQSKSAMVRAFAAENPAAGPSAIAAALLATGVKISAGHVSSALRMGKRKRKVPKRQVGELLARLLEAKRFVARAGGMEQARQALRALEILAA